MGPVKSAAKQQKRKVHYLGTNSAVAYTGTRMQPGHAGNRAGTKLGKKADDTRASKYRGGVVSKALENIAKAKRVAK
jgi:hypothetical protein